MYSRKSLAAIALSGGVLLALAACGGGAQSGAEESPGPTGKPQQGGVLRILDSAGPDHMDTAAAYYTVDFALLRLYARQLFTYQPSNDFEQAIKLVPDVATEIPTQDNGGISEDGKTYTIKLKEGVKWSTNPPRQVTASDFVLGLKRLCNPTPNTVGAPGYYTGTIEGMAAYCDGFAKVQPTVEAIKAYIQGNDVSGLKAVDDLTLEITLTAPASDFLNILASTFSSAAPEEYLSYLPDSPEFIKGLISNGPYKLKSYTANKEIVFDRNSAWEQSTDDTRHQYMDEIQDVLGQSNPDAVYNQIQVGTADLTLDQAMTPATVTKLKQANDQKLKVFPQYDLNPYLVFNLLSPNNNGTLGKNLEVRKAIEYAIDKSAIVKVYGGEDFASPITHVIPPNNVGYEEFDPYPTPDHKGDAAKCKATMKAAGIDPGSMNLKYVYRTSGVHPQTTQSIQSDLQACGFKVQLIASNPADFYSKYIQNVDSTKSGVWDIAAPGWIPDWYGNNGRAIIEPLFDGRHYGPNSTNYGDYNNDQVNSLIDQALAATDQEDAAKFWAQADRQIMADAAIVPLKSDRLPIYHSERVQNALYFVASSMWDLPNIWLKQ